MDGATESSPTIKALDNNRDKENLFGSPLQRKKFLFGKEYYFYNDGSVLVYDPLEQEYHFLTREGLQKGRGLRKSAKEIVENEDRLRQMKMLGRGRFSNVFELKTPVGPIAVKTTDKVGFYLKEFMEQETQKFEDPDFLSGLIGRGSGKKIIQKMSLADTMRLFRKLDEAGIARPEFYGFTVRRDPHTNEIQEFQFMERIDRPTIQSIWEAAFKAEQNQRETIDDSEFPYASFLIELSERYFNGDDTALMRELFNSFLDFVMSVKKAIPGIGDLEADNIFLIGYNEKEGKFEFMLIDPIEETIVIRPIKNDSNLIFPLNQKKGSEYLKY